MSTLYIAATAFQLITILNIRVNMDAPKGDLIIHEKSIPNSHYIKDRVVESGLFNRVFLFKDYDSRLNSVFTGKNTFWQYMKLVYNKHFTKLDINEFLNGEGYVDLSECNEVFCFNKKFLDIVGKYNHIKINFIDEGIGSYDNYIINTSSKINKIFLYKPELAVYYEKYKDKFITIPELDAKNIEFRNLLNRIWDYKEFVKIENNSIVVFDQPWYITPAYLEKCPVFIRNNILAASKVYKKYANDEKIKDFFVNTVKKLQTKDSNVIIKMHPRSSSFMKQYYIANGLRVMENTVTPWEIIFLNLNVDKIFLISVFSTAVLSIGMYFKDSDSKYAAVLLFKLLAKEEQVELPEETIMFLCNVSDKLTGIKIVDSHIELNKLII